MSKRAPWLSHIMEAASDSFGSDLTDSVGRASHPLGNLIDATIGEHYHFNDPGAVPAIVEALRSKAAIILECAQALEQVFAPGPATEDMPDAYSPVDLPKEG